MPLLVEPYCEKKILLDIAFIICVRVKEKITYICTHKLLQAWLFLKHVFLLLRMRLDNMRA